MISNNFIYFMSTVKNMVDKNSYFLMDNVITHKSKLFKKIYRRHQTWSCL